MTKCWRVGCDAWVRYESTAGPRGAIHTDHARVRARLHTLRTAGDRFAVTSQVVTEFVHIVTDARRLSAPLTMEQALDRARA